MPKVSVVIPCFNAGGTIGQAIQSVLDQTHQDVEVVVVDDGSTDELTRNVLANTHWPRTRIIHQLNRGPAAARNTAIQASLGEFILPLDADDTIEPEYIAKAVAVMEADPKVGIVYCKAMKFGAETGPWQLPAYSLRELVIDNVIFVTSLFRRADWLKVNGFNQSLLHGVEDYEFWVKIVALGREVVQLDEFLFNYRIQEVSRTTGFISNRSVVVSTYARVFRDNIDFFAANAEHLFEHRFGLQDELLRYRSRYGWLESMLVRRPWLQKLGRLMMRVAKRTFRGH